MAKKFNFKETKLYQETYKFKVSDTWPFRNIDVDDFLDSSKKLLQLEHDVNTRKINKQKVQAEVYMDRTNAATYAMKRYVQNMQMEIAKHELNAVRQVNKGRSGDMSFVKAKELVDYASIKMCDSHNKVCNALRHELEKKNIFVHPMDALENKNVSLEERVNFVINATKEHYNFMKNAYKHINNLIKYGLPADGVVGKTRDMLTGNIDAKLDNELVVDRILNSEADLYVIKTNIIPNMELEIQEYEKQALEEASEVKSQSELKFGELRPTDPYYFRRKYEECVKALDIIKSEISKMEEKEKELESDYKISINIDSDTATYLFVASWGAGEKTVKENKKQINNKLEKTSTITKEEKFRERSITLVIGQASRTLYEESRKRTAILYGYTNEQELGTKNSAIKNIVSIRIFNRRMDIYMKTKAAGKSGIGIKLSGDVVKVEEKLAHVKKQEGEKDKETTLLETSVGIGNVSGKLDIEGGIPTVGISAQAAGANANIAGVIKSSAGALTAGYNSALDLGGQINEAFVDHAIGADNSSAIETVKNIAESTAKKMQNVAANEFNAGIKIEVGGVTMVGISHDGKEIKVENRISDAIDSITNTPEQVDGKEEIVDNMSDEMVQEAIDMGALVVNDDINTPASQDVRSITNRTEEDFAHSRV